MAPRIKPDGPILPGVGLGGLKLGVHVQEYWHLLFDEYQSELFNAPDFFRWERKPWQHLSLFEARWDVPPIAISIDVRDGIVFKLSAINPNYVGTFDGIAWGASIGDLLARPDSRWDGAHDTVYLEGTPGIRFLQPVSDPDESRLSELYVDEIAVILEERGVTPALNAWPPRAGDE